MSLAFSTANTAYAADYYVSPSGKDGNSGTSPSSPWRTIKKANGVLRPGDVVYLRGGRYVNDPIRPKRSGTASAKIRYEAYGREQPVLTSNSPRGLSIAINLTDRSHIVVDGIDVDGVNPGPNAHVNHFANLYNTSYSTISNGTFRYANGWHGIRLTKEAHHNQLLNNEILFVGQYDDGTGHDFGDSIQILRGSHHNLLRGNTLKGGAHNLLQVDGPNNVIVENVFENDWSSQQGPGKGGRNLTLMGQRNVFERNTVMNAGASADNPANAGMKAEGQWNIVRRNLIFQNSNEGIITQTHSDSPASQHNRIFHNTIFGNGGPAWGLVFYNGKGITGNVFKNNIVYSNRRGRGLSDVDFEFKLHSNPLGTIGESLIEGNLIAKSGSGDARVSIKNGGGTMSLSKAERQHSGTFRNNIEAPVTFVVSNPRRPEDFELAPRSRGIDEALPLTVAKKAGSGTVVQVADASYFFDGFGLMAGDRIRIGGSEPVTVTKVDYGSNKLTLSKRVQWSKNAPITLDYSGNGPDVGAFELTQSAKPGSSARKPNPPQGLTSSTN